jgi:hypothetical protein
MIINTTNIALTTLLKPATKNFENTKCYRLREEDSESTRSVDSREGAPIFNSQVIPDVIIVFQNTAFVKKKKRKPFRKGPQRLLVFCRFAPNPRTSPNNATFLHSEVSVVISVNGLQALQCRVGFPAVEEIFLFPTTSRQDLITGVLSRG